MTYLTFTTKLKQYKFYKQMINDCKTELDVILYELTGVKGVSYDKVRGTFNPLSADLKRHDLAEKYEEKEVELKMYENTLASIEIVKRRLPRIVWSMCYDKFAEGMTYSEVGKKYGFTDAGVWKYMRREVEKRL